MRPTAPPRARDTPDSSTTSASIVGIAARIEDLAGDDVNDGAHASAPLALVSVMVRRRHQVGRPEIVVRLTVASIATSVSQQLRCIRASGQALGPSERAFAGSGCVSMNTPATPAATAARASTGTNSRWPPLGAALPARQLHRMRGVEDDRAAGVAHDRERAHVGDEVVVAERRAALAHHDVVARRSPRAPWRRRSSCPRARGTGPS